MKVTTRRIRGALVIFGSHPRYPLSSAPKHKPTRSVETITEITKPTRHATNKGARDKA